MQKKMWSVTKKILRNDIHWPLYTIFRHKTIKLPEVSQSLEERLSGKVIS